MRETSRLGNQIFLLQNYDRQNFVSKDHIDIITSKSLLSLSFFVVYLIRIFDAFSVVYELSLVSTKRQRKLSNLYNNLRIVINSLCLELHYLSKTN